MPLLRKTPRATDILYMYVHVRIGITVLYFNICQPVTSIYDFIEHFFFFDQSDIVRDPCNSPRRVLDSSFSVGTH